MKYGKYEYERSFLVTNDLIKDDIHEIKYLTDTYLLNTQLRLRKVTKQDTIQYKLTQKKELEPPRKGIKAINTLYLDKQTYAIMSALPGISIKKKRYIIIRQAQRIGIDEIEWANEKLYLAEMEYISESEMQNSPVPFDYQKEVTGDHKYSGWEIAKQYSAQSF